MSETAPAASLEATGSRRGERAGHRILPREECALYSAGENSCIDARAPPAQVAVKSEGQGLRQGERGKA